MPTLSIGQPRGDCPYKNYANDLGLLYQGKTEDDWRDEEPGKILHEIRMGEMARCNEIPHTPYYGTVDATPLWLMLYAEYYAWTYDSQTLDRLWPNALPAME